MINDSKGYGYPLHQRLQEFGISSEIIPIAHNTEALPNLPKKPFILSGGMTEVTADIDWIIDLKNFILDRIRENQKIITPLQPILGICFGAQIIAECYSPGSVTFLEDPEFGVSRIELNIQNHDLFNGLNHNFDAYSFHYNQIWSEKLHALSKHIHMGHTFLQAFEIPSAHAFGVQFHPEFRHGQMIQLFETHRELIADFGFDLQPIIDTLPVLSGNELILKNFFEVYCNS